MENLKIVVMTGCALAVVWSFWFFIPRPVLQLGLTQQQKIWSSDMTVYLDNKPLPNCGDSGTTSTLERNSNTPIATVICKYSCAPDGLCIFIPNSIIKNFKF